MCRIFDTRLNVQGAISPVFNLCSDQTFKVPRLRGSMFVLIYAKICTNLISAMYKANDKLKIYQLRFKCSFLDTPSLASNVLIGQPTSSINLHLLQQFVSVDGLSLFSHQLKQLNHHK